MALCVLAAVQGAGIQSVQLRVLVQNGHGVGVDVQFLRAVHPQLEAAAGGVQRDPGRAAVVDEHFRHQIEGAVRIACVSQRPHGHLDALQLSGIVQAVGVAHHLAAFAAAQQAHSGHSQRCCAHTLQKSTTGQFHLRFLLIQSFRPFWSACQNSGYTQPSGLKA